MLDLTGKVAFVAGAGSVADGWGNGRATAVLLARQGAKVFGTDYSNEALAGTSAVMKQEGRDEWTPVARRHDRHGGRRDRPWRNVCAAMDESTFW